MFDTCQLIGALIIMVYLFLAIQHLLTNKECSNYIAAYYVILTVATAFMEVYAIHLGMLGHGAMLVYTNTYILVLLLVILVIIGWIRIRERLRLRKLIKDAGDAFWEPRPPDAPPFEYKIYFHHLREDVQSKIVYLFGEKARYNRSAIGVIRIEPSDQAKKS